MKKCVTLLVTIAAVVGLVSTIPAADFNYPCPRAVYLQLAAGLPDQFRIEAEEGIRQAVLMPGTADQCRV